MSGMQSLASVCQTVEMDGHGACPAIPKVVADGQVGGIALG
jgi:hypothetical protein